jgi:cytochrome c oxidase cbb3-type subunit 3
MSTAFRELRRDEEMRVSSRQLAASSKKRGGNPRWAFFFNCSQLTAYCLLFTVYCLLPAFLLTSCKREERGFRVEPPAAARTDSVSLSELRPGESQPPAPVKNEYEENAYAMNEGKRLYEWFNCVGCHAHGGGGMGPALMDDKWLYGSQPEQVFSTIVQGRPNGMPSFRGKIPDYQVWQLAAYVRSMSGQVPSDAAPGRSDDMNATKPEQSKGKEEPKPVSAPK